MQATLELMVRQENWRQASIAASNLSELQLTLGDVTAAAAAGEAAVQHADGSGAFWRMIPHSTLADTTHQAGNAAVARTQFEEAEAIQAEFEPGYPRLYSLRGYRYCDLLLTLGQAEAVRERATYALEIAEENGQLLSIALDLLSLGRAALALGDRDKASRRLDQAVDGLRAAGTMHELPRGLLARAALFREVEEFTKSWHDLDEAMRIAERGGIRLFQCDAHLGFARLALAEEKPDAARKHLESAKALVSACGYHRRDGEVEELEAALA